MSEWREVRLVPICGEQFGPQGQICYLSTGHRRRTHFCAHPGRSLAVDERVFVPLDGSTDLLRDTEMLFLLEDVDAEGPA